VRCLLRCVEEFEEEDVFVLIWGYFYEVRRFCLAMQLFLVIFVLDENDTDVFVNLFVENLNANDLS
jgi:hypothetical protein